MALQRQELRDELVAMIAAGRELSPDHDYLLADVYLDLTRHRERPRSWARQLLENSDGLKNLLGAACIALAVLAFLLLAFAAGHRGDGFDQRDSRPDYAPAYIGGHYAPYWYFDPAPSQSPPSSDSAPGT